MLHRDIFPAEVHLPRTGDHYLAARVFITANRVTAWALDGGAPAMVLDESFASEPPERDRGTQGHGEIRLDTGVGPVFVGRDSDSGCGCGSPLKALDPPIPW